MKYIPMFALMLPLFLGSCAQQSLTGDAISRGEAGRAQSVQFGTITSIRSVNIQGDTTAGTLVGAGAGGLLGNMIGGGSGRRLATFGGAVAGSAIGSHAGQSLSSRRGLEIEVRLDGSRQRMSVIQEVGRYENFNVGDRVRVISGGGRTRVSH